MANPKELTVSQLRANLPRILHRTLLLRESFLIVKHGQPFAVLSPLTDEEDIERVRAKLTQEGEDRIEASEVLDAQQVT